jgi:hypothetical protein
MKFIGRTRGKKKSPDPYGQGFQIKNQPKHMNFYDTLLKFFFKAIYYRTTHIKKTLPHLQNFYL